MTKIFSISPSEIDYELIKEVASLLKKGKIVALPSETVYGLAGRADKKDVKDKLYALKERPDTKVFSIAVADSKIACEKYFLTLPPFGYRLIEMFWPGPLTLVYYSHNNDSVGIRVPAHIVTKEILRILPVGVYFPSANKNGEKEALTAEEVESVFNNDIDAIVNSGECIYAKSSTILDLTCSPFSVLREGVISEREIINVFMKKRILFVCTGNTCRSPMAQYILTQAIAQTRPYLLDRYEISSCGTNVINKLPMSQGAFQVLSEKENIHVKNFFSQNVKREALLSSDLIFAMSDSHIRSLLAIEPTIEGRVFNLKKFLPVELEQDIPDPIGGGYSAYEETHRLLKASIKELIDWL